jgi:hypothetical protein
MGKKEERDEADEVGIHKVLEWSEAAGNDDRASATRE